MPFNSFYGTFAEGVLKVLLVDADSTIPNLALMKIASYYKTKYWANVKVLRLNLPYYPDQNKTVTKIDTSLYDLVFCSVIFEGNAEFIKGDNINFGGSGFSNTVYLSKEIDDCEPDYSIYHSDFVNNTSIGYLTRGCIRKCEFCKVHVIEGNITRYRNVDEIVRHKRIKFLDNNILALPEHKEILQELISKKIKCQFNQGLDIRLVDEENSKLLERLCYFGEYIFAFDDIKFVDLIERKFEIMNWRKPWQFKFFVYIHPDIPLSDAIYRINWLRARNCLPYVMRHIDCWNSEYRQFYVDLAAWCNQVFAFKKLNFKEFLERRHTKQARIDLHSELWDKYK